MIQKQIVYLPIKVEDELPEMGEEVFTFNTLIKRRDHYNPYDDGKNMSVNRRIKELSDRIRPWYDEYNFSMFYSKVNTWLKPQEVFVFTPEQLNEYTANVIKQSLEIASEQAKVIKDMIDFGEWIRIKDFQNTSKDNWIGLDLKYYTTQELLQIWREQQPKIVYCE